MSGNGNNSNNDGSVRDLFGGALTCFLPTNALDMRYKLVFYANTFVFIKQPVNLFEFMFLFVQ